MGLINSLLPDFLKPLSRDIGFNLKSLIYNCKKYRKSPNKNILFVFGNQKSGTSVISALLGELTNQSTAIDLFYSGFHYSLFEKWKMKEISTKDFVRKNIVEFSLDILKEPHLSVFYDELKQDFPNAKFIFITRNPLDNIRSILDRLDIKGDKEILSKKEKRKIFHSWNLVFNNTWLGLKKSNYIETLAERWNFISEVYFKNHDDFILIKYEDFLSDKEKSIKQLAKKLNLDIKKDITHLLDYNFQPKGKKKSIKKIDFFGKENLDLITKLCEKNIRKFGY